MDSLTQVALGAAVGHSIMGRQLGRLAPVWGAALGTLPDLDVLISYGGVVEDFTYHRSFSHSLLVHLLITPLLVWLALKLHPHTREHRTRWTITILAILWTHALLDAFTVYGTQLLWPLTEYPFGLSSVFIIDPAYTLPLLIGLGLAAYFGWRSRNAFLASVIALTISSSYLVWSAAAKSTMKQIISETLAEQKMDVYAVLTTPMPFNTALWRVIALGENEYHVAHVTLWDRPDQVDFRRYPKGEELLAGLEDQWNVQRLQWFTKGFYKATVRDQQVVLSDLRMGVEGSYVFNFAVADLGSGISAPKEAIQIQDQIDIARLPLIWERLWSADVSLHPDLARVSMSESKEGCDLEC